MAFICHLLGVFLQITCDVSHQVQFPPNNEPKKETAVQKANVFEMEHFLQNNESADSTV